jgi:hypothetical protein
MSRYLMFSDDQLAKFKTFSQSLKNPHAGAHDAKPPKLRRAMARDEEVAPHVKSEMQNEGRGPDPHSTKRLSRLVRELFGEVAHGRFEEKVGERWPESLRENSEREEDLHEQRLEDDTDEDAEDDDGAQSSVAEEPLGEDDEDETDTSKFRDDQFRKAQNRKTDQRSRIGEDLPPAFPGRPTPGGKMLPNSPNGTHIPRKNSIAGDSYSQRWPDAAAISSDPPRRPRKIVEDRKMRKRLAMDASSAKSYAERFPHAARIKTI